MPRVVNAAVAVAFLLLLGPMVLALGGKPWYVQAGFVLFGLPLLLLAALALTSAVRPGSVGRAARRLRARRR